jgi:protein TonB
VFDLLVENRPRTRPDALRGGVVSFVLHSALIMGAVVATMRTGTRLDDPHPAVPIFFPSPPAPAPPPLMGRPMATAGPRIGFAVLHISPIVPGVIPPPSTAPFDPLNFTGLGPGEGRWNGVPEPDTAGRGAGAVYAARSVDERPELLSHPAVAYPEILRQAGIGGRAMIEAVIDTGGRAERGSLKVLSTTHPLFGQPAMAAVAASAYRPGRIDGRAVRVRVQIPIEFAVTGRSAGMFRTP